MALLLPHREGQYRAELFEELVRRILAAKYPRTKIWQDYVKQARHVDFFIETAPRPILVEARAPYSQTPWKGALSAIRQLRDVAARHGATAILVLASPIPSEHASALESIKTKFRAI